MTEYTRRNTGAVYTQPDESTLRALTEALKQNANDIKNNKSAGCAHFLGYLKKFPKDSSIPDECLTCSRILKCM